MDSGLRPSCPFHGVVSLDGKTFLHFVCLHPAVFYKWVLAIRVLQGLTLHYALSIPSHLGEVGGVAMQLSVACIESIGSVTFLAHVQFYVIKNYVKAASFL